MSDIYQAPERVCKGAYVPSWEKFKEVSQYADKEWEKFWDEQAQTRLRWIKKYNKVQYGTFEKGDIAWFLDGQINISDNCLDRWVETQPNKTAILWEGDEPNDTESYTYQQLFEKTCQLSNAMKHFGIKKGDRIGIYLPNCPQVAISMLACTRIGAIHSVVFAGFSSDALRDRLLDAGCKLLITADQTFRATKLVPLKKIADEALLECHCVKTVFVLRRDKENKEKMVERRDFWLHEVMEKHRPYCPVEPMDSEDPLFLLYTSGSTGKPKGMLHTQAGYLLYATLTHLWTFDVHPTDIYACVADVGWITGHSYVVYGPLSNGSTTFMFESIPTYPNASRYWQLIEKYKITQFYTSPTAIRSLMRFENRFFENFDLSSLRILGTVGEPINPEAWKWFWKNIGKEKCSLVDTFWQTESGGHLLTSLPATPQKAGAAAFGFPGIQPKLIDGETGKTLEKNNEKGVLVISRPWPGIARTIFGDHERYLKTYMKPYPGFYFTGDNAYRDKDGFYFITGRVDDVINVSGHRLGTAEIESALIQNSNVAESAVIGIPHQIKGQAIFCYVVLKISEKSHLSEKDLNEKKHNLLGELKQEVRNHIGAFATPDYILIVPGLPKTRSGKIMRRILRKIAHEEFEELGDISTLADPSIVQCLIDDTKSLFHPETKKLKLENEK